MRSPLSLLLLLVCVGLRAQNSFSPELTKFLLSHPAASLILSNVFAEASSVRKVEIYYFYTHDASVPKARHHYLGDSSTVGIFVRENQPACDQCVCTMFELLNSRGEKRFRELWGLAKSGNISKPDFSRETLRQEFEAVKSARDLIRKFDLKPEEITQSKSCSEFLESPDNFEAFLTSHRSDYAAYEELYDRIKKTGQ